MSLQANINLISIGMDGALPEYNAQIELVKGFGTNEFLSYNNEQYNINFKAPIFNNKPIIRVQDTKHAKKNAEIIIGMDGALPEYNAQIELVKGFGTNEFLSYNNEQYNINFKAPIFNNKPIIRVQDTKHAKKNAEIMYDQILTLAHEENSVLYLRDVINTDKQDDGELFDGYLNRTICHKTRIIMVMRAYFFLNVWKEYLNNCANIYSQKWYSFNKSCISIHSWKIFGSLAESMVLLVLAYRNYYSNYPFLLWEHGTESIEHLFAEGYIFDIDGSTLSNNDIEILCQWPTDNEIDDAVRIAYENAVSFTKLLKMNCISSSSTSDLIINDSEDEIESNINDEYCVTIKEAAVETMRLFHSMEIQYILNNEPSTDTYFVLEKEPEEDIFTNGFSIVAKILNIRKSHEAYSHSNICTNNDSGQTVRRRLTRWQGRKNIENMF
ncbi:19587_t:CDS:2 [Entrophospora sp. SA101]|nr:19587_t:CDS:2 [Entrophospora sp. SA101]